MKCDLCEHQNVHSDNNLLCDSCAEMIQRLLAVQEPTEPLKPDETALAAAPSAGMNSWGQWIRGSCVELVMASRVNRRGVLHVARDFAPVLV